MPSQSCLKSWVLRASSRGGPPRLDTASLRRRSAASRQNKAFVGTVAAASPHVAAATGARPVGKVVSLEVGGAPYALTTHGAGVVGLDGQTATMAVVSVASLAQAQQG